MGDLMRRYWIPAAFCDQVSEPDGAPVRLRLMGEDLVLFRDTNGHLGLLEDRCPHRGAALFFGRNEENGIRCVYHGIKFNTEGRCVDVPCAPAGTYSIDEIRVTPYPCVEKGGLVWAYMGPPEHRPDFPELEWTLVPENHRFVTRHVQECNWLQGLEGGFDAAHLSFLHSGVVDMRKGQTDQHRRIVPSLYEVVPLDFGFAVAGGRPLENGNVSWHVDIMLMPFHKIIPSVPRGAHVWAPIDDHNTMLYSINFDTEKPLDGELMEREYAWRGIHTENVPGTDLAVANKKNDYLIDRKLQASSLSYTGLTGLGVQDCALQESMGTIVDRTREYLLLGDSGIVKIRRLLLKALDDHAAGAPLIGMDPGGYRVKSPRYEAPAGANASDHIKQRVLASLVCM